MEWKKAYVDEIRFLRSAIRADERHLANAPLGPIQKSRLRKEIEWQKAKLKELNRKKRERKKLQDGNK